MRGSFWFSSAKTPSQLRDREVDKYVRRWKYYVLAEGDNATEEPGYEVEAITLPFVDKPWFNILMGFIITVNACLMGFEVDAKLQGRDMGLFIFIEVLFTILYTLELLARISYKRERFLVEPGMEFWNRLDFFIVVTSWIDFIIEYTGDESEGMNIIAVVRIARIERLLKILRLLRLVKLLKFFKELLFLVRGLQASVAIIVWFILIFVGLCWGTGCFLTSLVGQDHAHYDERYKFIEWPHERYFGSQVLSMLTLFQMITSDAGFFDDIMRRVSSEQPGMAFVLVGFYIIAVCVLGNLMISAVIDAVLENSRKHAENGKREGALLERTIFAEMENFFRQGDMDHSGMVSLDEIMGCVYEPEIFNRLAMINFPMDTVEMVFECIDFESVGQVHISDFVRGCLRIRGDAKGKDLLVAQVALSKFQEQVEIFEYQLEMYTDKVDQMFQISQAITGQGEMVFLNPQEYRVRHKSFKGHGMPEIRVDDLDKTEALCAAPQAEDAWLTAVAAAARFSGLRKDDTEETLPEGLSTFFNSMAESESHQLALTMEPIEDLQVEDV
jgi:hypothetical protein